MANTTISVSTYTHQFIAWYQFWAYRITGKRMTKHELLLDIIERASIADAMEHPEMLEDMSTAWPNVAARAALIVMERAVEQKEGV